MGIKGDKEKREGDHFYFMTCGMVSHIVILGGGGGGGTLASCISFTDPV